MIHEIALTIKPTLACNMRCKHCFNGNDLNDSMGIDINEVLRFLDVAAREHNDVKVTFHGGEPTLAGVDLYKQVFNQEHILSKKNGTKFYNLFTTNGLLIDEPLIHLFKKNDVLVNVSFDGPYNNLLRQHSEEVYNNICLLKEQGVRTRIFCTISRESFPHLLEIYKWFNTNSLDFKILPIEPRGFAAIDKSLLMDSDSFVETLVQVYKYWVKDKSCKVRFYTFEEFSTLRRDVQFKPFWFNREIALNPDGKIYPFGRPNDVQFCLGKPSEIHSLNDCFNSGEYKRMLEIMADYKDRICKGCLSSHICNSACLYMSYMYVSEDSLIKYSCHLSNLIFENILKVNDEIMQDLKSGNCDEYTDYIIQKFGE